MKKTICAIIASFVISNNFAAESNNQYAWIVNHVVDGDTFEVNKQFYPNELGNIHVRVYGIDTPEKNPRAKCSSENELAQKASAFTKSLIENKRVIVKNIKKDKYGGRVVADVYINGQRLADLLIKNGFAREYYGDTKQSWCP